jgi:hypothetical protein
MQQKESKTNWHFRISLLKSGLRILAGLSLILSDITVSGILFIGAELFGVLEEL